MGLQWAATNLSQAAEADSQIFIISPLEGNL